jgi:hypothetical protein
VTFEQAHAIYMKLSEEEREALDQRAAELIQCGFCGARPGSQCLMTASQKPVKYAHKGRQVMAILAEQELGDML